MHKVGHGFDVHRLVIPYADRRDLVIGGVVVPYEKVLKGHSDADVLIHALIDALLGAAALADIGTYFPPSDDNYAGMSSLILLERAIALIKDKHPNYALINADCTIMAERPKMRPYIELMREKLSSIMFVNFEQINIKATTTERLGFIGREEGIAAEAVVLIEV